MPFTLPEYHPPDFNRPPVVSAPEVKFEPVVTAGVAPNNYHGTSVYPEYFQLGKGAWRLVEESRMDCVVVRGPNDRLQVTEFRNLKVGDLVAWAAGKMERTVFMSKPTLLSFRIT